MSLEKNKVFFAGLISCILLIVQQLWLVAGETDLKVIGLALLFAVLGYLGNSWKLQGFSLTGIIGAVSYAAYEVNQAGFTWHVFVGTALVAILTTAATGLQQKEPPSPDSLTNKS